MKVSIGILTCLLSLAASPALAETKMLAKAGGWEVFSDTNDKGLPVCGISSNTGDKHFGLKAFSGYGAFVIRLSRPGWGITNGSKQRLTIQFDEHPLWNAVGTGFHFDNGDDVLQFAINKRELIKFIMEFGSSRSLRIHFFGDEAEDWSLDLNGADRITEPFVTCSHKV